MERCLVVANRTLLHPGLLAFAVELAEREPCTFHLVVPATAPTATELHGLRVERIPAWRGEAPAFSFARHRLQLALEGWASAGLLVDGEVGDADLVRAVREALLDHPADCILLSTLPRRTSRWLRADARSRLLHDTQVPVLHLEALEHAGPPLADLPLAHQVPTS